jgi:thioredoxin reductase (NADPH)
MSSTRHTRVLIIGAGPAGYTAAIYAARANLKPVLIEGMQPGGQLTITTEVENFPGFAEPIMGPELMERMGGQARAMGAEIVSDLVTAVDFGTRPFSATGDFGDIYTADAVIIATGAQARWLGVPGEERLRGYGVSACATCDGFFFRGREIAVVGGGNSAMEEALYLTNHASRVMLVHRRDALRGEKILQDRVARNPKIVPVWNSVVESIEGTGGSGFADPPRVTGLALRDVKTGERSLLPVEGVFVAIGHAPATEIFKGQIETDAAGYLVTAPDSTATAILGVFAAGDVKDHTYRQAVTAAGMGCMAALEAERWLAALG